MTFEALVQEFRHARVGPAILSEVRRAVRLAKKGRDPYVFTGAHSWDDAEEDVVQGVIVDVLLKQGQLDYIFTTASDLGDFRRLMVFQVRRYLNQQRQRSVIDNLLERARDLLEEDPTWTKNGKRPRIYRRDQDKVDRTATADELAKAARAASVVPTIAPKGTERAPAVYSTKNLKVLLTVVGESLPTVFGLTDLRKILDQLLTAWTVRTLKKDEEVQAGIDPQGSELSGEEEALVADAVGQVLQALDPEERLVLRLKFLSESDVHIARLTGRSRPTVMKRGASAAQKVGQYLSELPERLQHASVNRLSVRLLENPDV